MRVWVETGMRGAWIHDLSTSLPHRFRGDVKPLWTLDGSARSAGPKGPMQAASPSSLPWSSDSTNIAGDGALIRRG